MITAETQIKRIRLILDRYENGTEMGGTGTRMTWMELTFDIIAILMRGYDKARKEGLKV